VSSRHPPQKVRDNDANDDEHSFRGKECASLTYDGIVDLIGPENRGRRCRSLPATPHVTLRDATTDDAALLEFWDSKEHVQLHSGAPEFNAVDWYLELSQGEAVPWQTNLVAEVNGIPIGYIAILDPVLEQTRYWGDEYCAGYKANELAAIDIWIGEENYLNQGYGTAMMRTAIELYCFRNNVTKEIIIDPMVNNVAAHRFYQRLGFRPENKTHFFGPDCCLVHRLSRKDYFDVNGAE
jgi:aminoglycoside 6'-N-acetyltransferase